MKKLANFFLGLGMISVVPQTSLAGAARCGTDCVQIRIEASEHCGNIKVKKVRETYFVQCQGQAFRVNGLVQNPTSDAANFKGAFDSVIYSISARSKKIQVIRDNHVRETIPQSGLEMAKQDIRNLLNEASASIATGSRSMDDQTVPTALKELQDGINNALEQ